MLFYFLEINVGHVIILLLLFSWLNKLIYIYCIPVLLLPGDGWSLFKNFYYLYKIKQYIVISYRNILNYLQIEQKWILKEIIN